MKKRYRVAFIKQEIYYVDAESREEAEELAFDEYSNDKYAFSDFAIDEIEINECY